MDYPFYFTWTKRQDAPKLPVNAAHGITIRLENGLTVIDMISTNFQAAFGHDNTRIIEAIKEQLDIMPIASPKGVFKLKEEQTLRLCNFLKLHEEGKVFYTVSGAGAIENALKMARRVTGRKLILAREKSYHGATLGAMSVTGDWRGKEHFSVSDLTVRIPEPDDDPDLSITETIIREKKAENIAAFCLETITGMNGVIIPPRKWWGGIQTLCEKYNILLIADEVSCGFRRTGADFGFHHYQIRPNFVCMAKAITGGYVPFGALWTDSRVAKFYNDHTLSCGLTNYAHPLGLAAMKAVLDHFDDNEFRSSVSALETIFYSELNELKRIHYVKDIRQSGLLAAIVLDQNKKISWQDGVKGGLHIACKEDMIILAPPLVIKEYELKEGMALLREVIR